MQLVLQSSVATSIWALLPGCILLRFAAASLWWALPWQQLRITITQLIRLLMRGSFPMDTPTPAWLPLFYRCPIPRLLGGCFKVSCYSTLANQNPVVYWILYWYSNFSVNNGSTSLNLCTVFCIDDRLSGTCDRMSPTTKLVNRINHNARLSHRRKLPIWPSVKIWVQ